MSRLICHAFFVLVFSVAFSQDLVHIDSLHRQLRLATTDSAVAYYHSEISYQWCGINFDSANYHADACSRMANKSGSSYMIGLALNSKALVFDYAYQFDSALYYYNKAMRYAQSNQNLRGEAVAIFNIGLVYYFKGDLDSAISNLETARPVFEALNEDFNLSKLYNNLGRIYEKTNQLDYALEVSRKSIQIKERIGDTKGLLNTYTNMSSIFQRLEQYDSALVYSLKCSEKAKEIGDRDAYKGELVNLGIIYKNMDLGAKALATFEEAEKLIQAKDDPYIISEIYHNLGLFYFEKGNLRKTGEYLTKIKKHLLEEKYLETVLHHYQLEYLFHKASGNLAGAISSLEKYVELRERFLTQETLKQTNELEQLYEKEKREVEIKQLNAENDLKALRLQKQLREQNGLLVGIALVIGVAILLYVLYRQKQKTLEERETLLKEIHHRVKNNLQIISSLLNLQAGSLEDEAAIDAVKEGQNRVRSMALIHENLYLNDKLSGIEVNDYVQNLTETLFQSFGVDEEAITAQLSIERIRLDTDTLIPLGLILNELISNSLKYAFKTGKGILFLKLVQNKGVLELVVKDDGVGLEESNLESSNSYGWKMIKSLARKLKADIRIHSNEGTEISLMIKNYKLVA